jgi:hypothetical protein
MGESLVLAGTEPAKLLGKDVDPASVVVRSTHLATGAKAKTVVYEADKDYVVDGKAGTVARTKDSRIPDFEEEIGFRREDRSLRAVLAPSFFRPIQCVSLERQNRSRPNFDAAAADRK